MVEQAVGQMEDDILDNWDCEKSWILKSERNWKSVLDLYILMNIVKIFR